MMKTNNPKTERWHKLSQDDNVSYHALELYSILMNQSERTDRLKSYVKSMINHATSISDSDDSLSWSESMLSHAKALMEKESLHKKSPDDVSKNVVFWFKLEDMITNIGGERRNKNTSVSEFFAEQATRAI